MKYFVTLMYLLSFNLFGQVQAPSEDLLEGDLSFKLSEEQKEETRGVASEGDTSKEKPEAPEKSQKLEYWKY